MDCNHENKKEEEVIFGNGVKHIKLSCVDCGKWLKWKGQGGEPKLYFGKHKGKTILEIARIDLDYLHWLYDETTNYKLKGRINEVLSKYKYGD